MESRLSCFCYLRVSGKGQVDGDGFDRQLLACQSYAATNDIEIAEVFYEKGVTGVKELDDRPALSELFAALEENGVKTVLIEKLDRLARDLMVQETIISDMRKHGYTLLSAAEPDLCSDDPSRILVRQIFGAIAQYEKSMIVLKLRGARQRKRARHGKCEGRTAFGVKPGESKILHTIIALHGSGIKAEKIAEALNANGVHTRYGKEWLGSTVNRILKRESGQ